MMKQALLLTLLLPAGAGLAGLLAGPAVAVTDATTGFGIAPPAPFVAGASAPNAEDVAFSIRSTTSEPPAAGTGALCRVGLKQIQAGAPRASQEALNSRVDDEGFREAIRKPLKTRYVVHAETLFEVNGARGVEFATTPRAGPNASEVRVVLSFIEAPAGRISLVCATPATHLEAARPAFEAIRATLILPK